MRTVHHHLSLTTQDMAAAFKVLHAVLLLGTLTLCVANVLPFEENQDLNVVRPRRPASSLRHLELSGGYDDSQGPRQSRQAESRRRQSPQTSQWALDYDPSEILSPPELQPSETQYRTMSTFRRPAATLLDNSPVIWGTPKKGAVVSRPGRASGEGGGMTTTTVYYAPKDSRKRQAEEEAEEEEEEEEEGSSEEAGYTQEGHSFHQVPASIYSFFGTDANGNFNWGQSPTNPALQY